MIQQIVETINEMVREKRGVPIAEWINSFKPCQDAFKHNFVVFLKPELTAVDQNVRIGQVLQVILYALAKWNVEIGAVRVLSSEYLRQYNVIGGHYGILNKVSKKGAAVISFNVRQRIMERYADDLNKGAEILGAHEFLERFPSISAFDLRTRGDIAGAIKLEHGTHCARVEVDGRIFLVLNPFHPYQLEYYTHSGRAIVVFECCSHGSWMFLRKELAGATNPAEAAEGSIRRSLLDNRKKLQLVAFGQGYNGIHLSAGPLEGMVDVQRFFSEDSEGLRIALHETCFGQLLLSAGLSIEKLQALAQNAMLINQGRELRAFDLTEEMDAKWAVKELKASVVIQ